MRPLIIILAVAALGITAYAVLEGPSDPEEEIRRMIQAVAEAAEQRKLGGVLEHISEDFAGEPGDMNKDGLKGLLFVQLRRGEWRKVFMVGTRVHVESDTSARAVTTAVLASGDAVENVEDVAETDAGTYRFDLQVRKEDGDWRVLRAEYERVAFGDLFGE